jgi:hypothetical protein
MGPAPEGTQANPAPFHNPDWANSWTMGALSTIAANSIKNWPSLLHTTAEIEIDKAAKLIQVLRYFSPLLLHRLTSSTPCIPRLGSHQNESWKGPANQASQVYGQEFPPDSI